MWITPRSTGRLFNESTGRGQQLVACVWAGRIRPLALGSPAPPSSSLPRFPHLLTHPFIQPSSPLLSPIENEVLCPFHYCPSWSWAWAAGAFWSASTRTRAEPSWAPHSPGCSLPPQTNTSPQTPCAGKRKKKNEQNRERHQQNVRTIPMRETDSRKNTEDCGQNTERGTFHSKVVQSQDVLFWMERKTCNPTELKNKWLCYRKTNTFPHIIKSVDLSSKELYSIKAEYFCIMSR